MPLLGLRPAASVLGGGGARPRGDDRAGRLAPGAAPAVCRAPLPGGVLGELTPATRRAARPRCHGGQLPRRARDSGARPPRLLLELLALDDHGQAGAPPLALASRRGRDRAARASAEDCANCAPRRAPPSPRLASSRSPRSSASPRAPQAQRRSSPRARSCHSASGAARRRRSSSPKTASASRLSSGSGGPQTCR